MSGKSPLLCLAIGVITEASLLLEVENEYPHLYRTYLGDIGTQTATAEEIVEVDYTIDDNCQGIRAFPFGRSAQLITMKQTAHIGARI